MTIKLLLALVLALPTYKEDDPASPEKKAQQSGLAAAIQAEKLTPDQAAFLLSWGDAETHYSLRIHRGDCRRWECDRGRARGPFQVHRNGLSDADWDRQHGIENTPAQVREAARRARWALRQCAEPNRIVGAFRVLGGNGCQKPLRGEEQRLATFNRIRKRM